jgi:hypothetical protein
MVALRQASFMIFLATTACGFPRPSNVASVSGQVHGLWSGADGVVLQLQTNGAETQLTVPSNGPFQFPDQLIEGSSYSVTVSGSPARHKCIVDSGGNGTVTTADIADVSIACTGPDLALSMTGAWNWTFDPSQEMQRFSGSVMVQDIALTVTGATLTGITVNGTVGTIGKQSEPTTLPLGATTIPVELHALGGLSKTYQLVFERGGSVIEQVVYGKATNPEMADSFGTSIALSGDTLAVGAAGEDSSATGLNGDQADNKAEASGAVFVFVRSGTTWTQQAYIKASNTDAGDLFGTSVALSGDTLAVGAKREASNAAVVNGNQADNSAPDSGAVYVFVRNASIWTQQAYIKPSDTAPGHVFGTSVSLSGDTLAVSGNLVPAPEGVSGGVYIFVRSGTRWTQQRFLIPPDNGGPFSGVFLLQVALSGDTLAIPAQEVNQDSTQLGRGVVYVFVRSGTTWTQEAYLTVTSEGIADAIGEIVSLSGDSLAVGAPLQLQSATTRVVRIFMRTGTTWSEQAQVMGSNTEIDDQFGTALAISGDTLAVGAYGEDSKATGVNGDEGDGATSAGAVYLFLREKAQWAQKAYIKASNTGAGDAFGICVGLSDDTLAIGAPGEASRGTGINAMPGQDDDSTSQAGAIYVFR